MTGPLVSSWRRLWLHALVGATLLFLIVPIFVVIPVSFSDSKYLAFPPAAYSTRWYAAYLGSSDWLASTAVSLKAAAFTTILSTAIGTAAAYAIDASGGRIGKFANVVILLPLVVPHILIAIGVFYVYVLLGLVNTMVGIVLAHTLIAMPLVVVTVLAGLKAFDPRQEQVARSLGASRPSAFLRVTLPQILPSVIAGGLFAFVVSLDEVVISLFVSGGDNTVLTRRMFAALRDAIDPTIAAISTFFIAISIGVSGIILLSQKNKKR